jgi:uncharacterized RDD family membrane protein YckC
MSGKDKDIEIASLTRRVLGGLIDLIITYILVIMLGSVSKLGKVEHTNVNTSVSVTGWNFIISLIICFLLFSLMEFLHGKTIGKYITGTKVVSDKYQDIKIWQALLRNQIRLIDIIGFYLVGFISLLLNKKRQRLGDFIAKTYVIRNKK